MTKIKKIIPEIASAGRRHHPEHHEEEEGEEEGVPKGPRDRGDALLVLVSVSVSDSFRMRFLYSVAIVLDDRRVLNVLIVCR